MRPSSSRPVMTFFAEIYRCRSSSPENQFQSSSVQPDRPSGPLFTVTAKVALTVAVNVGASHHHRSSDPASVTQCARSCRATPHRFAVPT